jgi:hypothetical protein
VSVTAQVPGVHDREIVFADGLPVQLCGPLSVTVPSAPTLPVKPLNGAAKESEQLVSVTAAVMPMSDESQCCVTVQLPVMSGHAASLPPPVDLLGVPDESEPQENARNNAKSEIFLIFAILTAHSPVP